MYAPAGWMVHMMLRHSFELTASFDHLVGAGEQRRRHGEAEGFGGLEIDDKIELGGLLDRQIGCLFALENSAGIDARDAERFGDAGAVTHQPTRSGVFLKRIDRWQFVACCEFYDPDTPGEEEGITADHQRSRALLDQRSKARFQFAVGPRFDDLHL